MNSDSLEQFKIKVAEELVYRHMWSICENEDVPSLHEGCALYDAIDKNLHLITDIGAEGAHLPYEVYDCDDVPAPDYDPADVAFSDHAREGVGKIAGKLSGTDEPVSNPYKLPRLVEVEDDKPTLDQMPEWERHLCGSCTALEFPMIRIGGDAWYAEDSGPEKSAHPPEVFTVRDAPAPQRTVKDLRPGDVVILDGRWSICTKAFALVDLLDGAARNPRSDTPIDKVYRFEPEDQ